MGRSINRKIPRVALCGLLLTTLLGCSGIRHAPIEPVVASTLSGKEVMVVKRRVPDFAATIRDKASLAGLLGVPLGLSIPLMLATARSSGNTIVHENDIHDPAYKIAEEIAASLGEKYGTKYTGIGNVEISGDDDDVSIISAVYQSAPLALDRPRPAQDA